MKRMDTVFAVMIVVPESEKDLPAKNKIAAAAAVSAPLLSRAKVSEESNATALLDDLTSLPNERAMRVVLEQQIAESERYGIERKLSVLAIDIQNFDYFNEHYGHLEGDRALAFAARILKQNVRKMDFVARISADEFVVVLPKIDGKTFEHVTARVSSAFATSEFSTRTGDLHTLQPSFGLAVFGEDGYGSDDLIRHALEDKSVEKGSERGDLLVFPSSKRQL